jgi:chemotaxis protein CheX
MTAPFPIDCYRNEIAATVQTVFETMFDRAARFSESSGAPAGYFTAAVYYAGAWQGALLLECSAAQAESWAARLMLLPGPVSADDARDGLGEVANVIAGNLKAVLPPGVGLSIPSVVQGSDYSLRICGGNLTERLVFEEELGAFCVTLVEVMAGAAAT